MTIDFGTLKKDISMSAFGGVLISLLIWAGGFYYLQIVHASSLSQVSDTLSDSRPGMVSNHTISFVNPSSTTAGQTIVYTFDPNTILFGSVTSTVFANVTSTGMLVASTSCPGSGSYVSMATTSYNALTFTVCGSNTIPSGTITLKINNTIANPTSTGSYVIRIVAAANSVDTRVTIVNGVQVTAAVATTFTFSVSSLPTSTLFANNATTTGADTSTTMPFGTIVANTHNELGQQLNVTTNAANGFAVTVHEDQDMMSSKGTTIHLFQNGSATATPRAWTSPSSTINNSSTYGHIGITSDDTDLGGGIFGTSTPLYAGGFQSTSTLVVFSATGTADGTTQDIGAAKIGVRIETGPLQPPANDYSNNLIYIATPTF